MSIALRGLVLAFALPAAVLAQPLPQVTDEMLKQATGVLHVDAKTGRLAGITDRGPVAEVGAKIVEVVYGDYKADEWLAYTKPVEGEYVKPAVSQRRSGHVSQPVALDGGAWPADRIGPPSRGWDRGRRPG